MTTQEIATRLVELCRMGQYETAQRELFADDAVSIEPEGNPMSGKVEGLEGIVTKGHHFMAMVEEIHGGTVSDPVIAGNVFSVAAVLDATYKGRGRMLMEEICVYKVKDGKIAQEQFVY
jgi:hypothetical protein